jgi:hypothetical protein
MWECLNARLQIRSYKSPLRNKLSPAQKSEISFESSLQSFHIGFFFFLFFFQALKFICAHLYEIIPNMSKPLIFFLSVLGGMFTE